IAMQVARLQSNRRRHLLSKAQEAVEALVLVHRYGHDAILRHYLTLAPYGARVHGAERAARFYFDKPAADLSWLQAAWLAGLPQQPTRLGPFVDGGLQRGLARAHRILMQLHDRGYLDDDEFAVAVDSQLDLVDRRPRPGSALHLALRLEAQARRTRRAQIAAGVDVATTVKATLDLDIQQAVHRIVVDNVAAGRDFGASNGAAIVVDADNGDVVADVGSTDWFDDKNHGAIDYTQARRSPGSTIKPFIYALALDPNNASTNHRVFTAASPLADTPMGVIDDRGKSYVPKNITRTFLGPMPLREALGNSRNIPALRVLADVGVPRALRFFDDAGVADVSFLPGQYGLGLALGNLHVSAEELARLYLILRHHGMTKALHFSDLDDDSLGPAKRLLPAGAADLVTHILADPAARRPSFSDGSALDYDSAVAIKTGTSQGYRDGWTVAFSDRLLVVMWIGNHDWRRMNHLGGLAGTADATHSVFDVVTPKLHRHAPLVASMPLPAHSERRDVCAMSGELAGHDCPHRRAEVFLAGTAPSTTCSWHQRVGIDVRTNDLANDDCPNDVVVTRAVVDLPDSYRRWAQATGVPLKPQRTSRLCGGRDDDVTITLAEPEDGLRLAWDPDTPPEFSTIRLVADVDGAASDDVVFLVDDVPVAKVGHPHEARWSITPGVHTIKAVLASRPVSTSTSSSTATITVRR
ncbi:MAG TPA: transglycosylase domain-containing protein, partial [Myxococcota bacterium]